MLKDSAFVSGKPSQPLLLTSLNEYALCLTLQISDQGPNLIKHFIVVIYCCTVVVLIFYVIKQYYHCNYYEMRVNYRGIALEHLFLWPVLRS